ncbi:MAG: ABC transporter permease, partial [Chloroflexia bacterium]
ADRFVQRISNLPRVPAMAVRNLGRRKGRNLVTVMAIGLATAAFLAAQGTSMSVNQSIDNAYNVYDVDAWVWFNEPVGQGFAATLRSMPEVRAVEAWASSGATIADTRMTMWGIPPDTSLYRYRLTAGRWFGDAEPEAAVLSSVFASANNLKVGDKVEVSVGSEDALMTVVGVVNDNAQGLQSSSKGKIFVPLDTAARLMHRSGAADFFSVRLDSSEPTHVEDVLAQMERKYHTLSPGMLAAYADKQSSLEASKILTILLYAMTVIVAAIGGIGIANTLTLNVLERRREIGVMRSVGGRNSHLIQVFLTEALVMGLGGFVVGVGIGYPLARLLVYVMSTVLFPLDFVFPSEMVAGALGFTLLLTGAASIGPALGAARLKVSYALRYE